MIDILHCADLHLDTPFSGLGDMAKSAERRRELRETFARMIDWAKANGTKVLLIAGDLIDDAAAVPRTAQYLSDLFLSAPGIHFFISPGNHDFYGPKSMYRLCDWPGNVKIFTGGIERVDVPACNLCVYGAGFSAEYADRPLFRDFRVEEPDKINMMVIHGDLAAPASRYNPIDPGDIERSGLDYLALGHVHAFSGIRRSGKTYYCYPGTPEGRGFDELGDKGFVAGRVGKNYCDARFIRACRRRYFRLEADMTGLFSTQEAYGEVRRRLPAEPGEDLVQVELTGELPSGAMLDREGLARLLGRDFYYAGVTDRTRAELPREKELAENSLRGIFVRKMLERIAASKDEEEARVLELALRCGSAALLGGEVEEL